MAEFPSGGTAALVVAAGRGERAGGPVPKQYRLLAGESVAARAAGALLRHPRIDAAAVVIAPGHEALYAEACGHLPLLPPVAGGAERQDSVRAGLEALAPLRPDRVLAHDAARPFLPPEVVDRLLDALDGGAAAAAPVLPVVDTLKRVEGGAVTGTVDRAGLARAQTPQAFRFDALLEGHRALAGAALTDDMAVAERMGARVAAVPGAESLFKITGPEDFERAARHLALGRETRTGIGYDVHRFGPGASVTLCGVEIPHERGLVGHSDADVGLHALTDALLGAIGAGDIGQHFPPSDPRWRGAASELFLRHAAGLVRARGGEVANVDVVLVCERPRIGPRRDAMRRSLTQILQIPEGRANVKATTTERLGFAGRGEGVAAQAVAAVRLPVGDA